MYTGVPLNCIGPWLSKSYINNKLLFFEQDQNHIILLYNFHQLKNYETLYLYELYYAHANKLLSLKFALRFFLISFDLI
jgi:hypothetical protein